jgi:OOP family OmpA-OmpF porin
MKKFNKLAMLVASAALVTAAGAQTVDNWRNGSGDLVWKNGTQELCWRDANWTPATAAVGCDGAIVAPKALSLIHI